jgi:hypothetical protein
MHILAIALLFALPTAASSYSLAPRQWSRSGPRRRFFRAIAESCASALRSSTGGNDPAADRHWDLKIAIVGA